MSAERPKMSAERPKVSAERPAVRTALAVALRRGALSWPVLALAAFVLGRAAIALPPLGDPGAPAAVHVSPRYIEDGPHETGARNMVTGVLADYRSFDTLGETVVVLAAGLACVLLLSRPREPDEDGRPL